ncbi:MAG: DMT family transporter [Ignavibacteria bacterium]|nr:DMT family transporter [Ignavibacteria bacterium]
MPQLHRKGVAALIITAFLWSTGGLLIKILPLSPLTISGTRSAIAAVVILLWVRHPKPTWSAAQWGSIVSYCLTVLLFVVATKMTTAANAIFLQYTAPIWVALFSAVITKERLTRIDVITVIVVMAGMSVFFIERVSMGNMVGNLIAVGSGVAFACVALCMRAQHGKSTVESILLGNVLTAIVCLPFLDPFPIRTDIIVGILSLGMLQLGISYILYSWAIAHVTAIEAVLITTLEPLLNPVWVALFYSEVPSSSAIVGGIIVITALATRNFVHAQSLRRIASRTAHQ